MSNTYSWILGRYRALIEQHFPQHIEAWPVLSGADVKVGGYRGWEIWAFIHSGNSGSITTDGVGQIPARVIGFEEINDQNKEAVRKNVERFFRLGIDDCVIMIKLQDSKWALANIELTRAMRRHEAAMGIGAMRIFLSHKGADKPMVRDFDRTLRLLGFDTWLDEDAMTAGAHLERAISKGFEASCAAVFFVTANYKDEGYLATEVDYAIREKRNKGDAFQIVTIAFDGVTRDSIPELIRSYVWKTPASQLEALQEVVRALPIKVGETYWR